MIDLIITPEINALSITQTMNNVLVQARAKNDYQFIKKEKTLI